MSGFPLVSERDERKPNQLTKAVQEVQPWYNCTTTDMKVSRWRQSVNRYLNGA